MPLRSSFRIAALTLASFLPAVGSAAAQQPDALHTASRQELDVIKVLLAQEAAWNRGDLTAFISAYKDAPDTLFITHQVSRGFSGLLDEYKHDYPSKAAMGTLGFSELEVRPLGEIYAVALGRYRLERSKKDGGNADGLFTLVLEKTDNGWKIIIDHTT